MNGKIMSELPFIPFALPQIGEEEIAEVADALRSGWVTTGPKTKQFETDFAAYLGGEVEAIAVNSATAGLHLALEALGVGPGDEVIVPTMTFTATAEVVRYLGADPIFVDCCPTTLNIDVEGIKQAISAKTKVIMPVHYGGLACDMDKILALAAEHGIKVLEDAAHAFPTRFDQQLIGTLDSDVAVFSFYANKTMTTGEGGMVVTKNQALAKRIKVMRLHGISRDAFDRFTSEKPAWYYEVVAPGFKYNMPDTAAAMGIHQLKRIDQFWQRREYLAKRYFEQLADLPLILPARADSSDVHSWHLYVIRLTEQAPCTRDELIEKLAEAKIGTSVHYVPLHRHPYWRDSYQLSPEQFPQADKAYLSMLSIPLYTKMTDEQQDHIIATLRQLLGK
tara:strand:+ start:81542 stop:82717 length:1176 start_codon:yes stop_codon:yes gene_type:complete